MRSRFSNVAIAVAAVFAYTAPAVALPTDFETNEYFLSGALDIINASEAYDLGYTGKGQTVGIIDTPVVVTHPELAGKSDYVDTLPSVDFDVIDSVHGTHVSGIAAASKDGVGMHGVAFESGIWSLPYLVPENYQLDLDAFFARDDVRIYNNSWGYSIWNPVFTENMTDVYDYDHMMSEILANDPATKIIIDHFLGNSEHSINSVAVFAAGNDGQLSPAILSLMARYFGNGTLSNYLTVSSIDPACVTRNNEGNLVLSGGSTGVYSDLAYGAELFTVSAPGTNIYSAFPSGYAQESGTSMAAPVVSGVLALVAQAHPWMTGKLLADAVLTTANNSFEMPDYFIQLNLTSYEEGQPPIGGWLIRLIKTRDDGDFSINTVENLSEEEIAQLIWECCKDGYGSNLIHSEDAILKWIKAGKVEVLSMTREQIYGQGIVDAAKAVRGIARLDANRLKAENVLTVSELDETFAIEMFNTKGYTSEFSNDISERQWDNKYHHPEYQTDGAKNTDAVALQNKSLGLLKAGNGTLILSGTNTYNGATIVEGGVLAIAQRADQTGGVLENSDVVVRENGTLMGDGHIENELINNGTVIPGWRGDTLVVGNYQQGDNATLNITFDTNGDHTALEVKNSATLDGTLVFTPQSNVFYQNGSYALAGDAVTAPTISGDFDTKIAQTDSPTLSLSLDTEGNGIVVNIDRPGNAYSQWAQNSSQASVGSVLSTIAQTSSADMQSLISAIDWSGADGHGVTTALRALTPNAYSEAGRSSVIEQNEFNVSVLSNLLNNRLNAARLPTSQDTLWVTPFRTDSREGITSYGLMAGFDRTVSDALTVGTHFAVSDQKTEVEDMGGTEFESRGAHVGAQVLYGPESWSGAYIAGGLRIGVQDAEMKREVAFPGYSTKLKSDWTQFSGSTFFAVGKEWEQKFENATLAFGPIAWAEYALARRPSVTEKGEGAAALQAQAETYDSLILSAGLRMAVNTLPDEDGSVASAQLLTAWRHEVLDDHFRTQAHFVGYGPYTFTGESEYRDRDTLLVQAALRLTVHEDFYANLDVGGELFRDDSSGVNVGLTLGWTF